MKKERPGRRIYGPDAPNFVEVDRALADWIARSREMMANSAKKVMRTIHGQRVEVIVLPLADVRNEFPYRPNVYAVGTARRRCRKGAD